MEQYITFSVRCKRIFPTSHGKRRLVLPEIVIRVPIPIFPSRFGIVSSNLAIIAYDSLNRYSQNAFLLTPRESWGSKLCRLNGENGGSSPAARETFSASDATVVGTWQPTPEEWPVDLTRCHSMDGTQTRTTYYIQNIYVHYIYVNYVHYIYVHYVHYI